MAKENLDVIVSLKDQASKKVKDITGAVDKLSSAALKAAKAVGVLTAAFAGLSIREFAEFEQGMSKVKAITGATGKDFDDLTEKAKEMGRTTAFTAKEASDAMTFLGMAGFETADIMKAVGGTLDLAAASGIELGRAADIASNVLTGFRLDTSQTGRVVDVMAKTITSSNTNMEQMAEAMKFFAPTAAAFGITVEEASATIGLLGNAGLQGTIATQAFATALVRLAKPTAAMQTTMDELGLTFFDAQGEFIGFTEMIGMLEKRFENLTTEQRQAAISTIFGQRAVKQFNVLLSAGSGELKEFTGKLKDSGGTAQHMAEVQLDNLRGQFTILRSAISGLMIEVGAKFEPFLRKTIATQIDFVRSLTNNVDAIDEVIEAFQNLKRIAMVAIDFLIGVANAFAETAGPRIKEALGTLNEAFGKFADVIENIAGRFGGFESVIHKVANLLGVVFGESVKLAAKGVDLLVVGIGKALDIYDKLKARIKESDVDFKGHAEKGLGVAKDAYDKLKGKIGEVDIDLSEHARGGVKLAKNSYDKLKDKVGEVDIDLEAHARKTVGDARKAYSNINDVLGEFNLELKDIVDVIALVLKPVLTLTKKVAEFAVNMDEEGKQAIVSFVESLKEMGITIWETTKGAIKRFIEIIGENKDKLIALKDAIKEVIKFGIDKLRFAVDKVKVRFERFKDRVREVMETVTDKFDDNKKAVKTWEEKLDVYMDGAKKALDVFATSVETTLNYQIELLEEFSTKAIPGAMIAWNNLKDVWEDTKLEGEELNLLMEILAESGKIGMNLLDEAARNAAGTVGSTLGGSLVLVSDLVRALVESFKMLYDVAQLVTIAITKKTMADFDPASVFGKGLIGEALGPEHMPFHKTAEFMLDKLYYDRIEKLKETKESLAGMTALEKAQYLATGRFQFRAGGGPVKAGNSYMVGERGQELFIPSQNGKIVPNNKLNGGVTINVQGNFVGSRDEAIRLGDIITRRLGLSTAMV